MISSLGMAGKRGGGRSGAQGQAVDGPGFAWSLRGRSVLIVEDDFAIADDLQRAFERLGARVVGPVPVLDQALDLIQGNRPVDAAVLDINLRGTLVFPLARILRERGIPFVFATGYDQSVVPVEFRDVTRFEKPVDPLRIAQALFR